MHHSFFNFDEKEKIMGNGVQIISTQYGDLPLSDTGNPVIKDPIKIGEPIKINNKTPIEQTIQENTTEEKTSVDNKRIVELAKKVNELIDTRNLYLSISYLKDISQYQIKFVDKESNKVVKEIPPEQILNMIKHLHSMGSIAVDEQI